MIKKRTSPFQRCYAKNLGDCTNKSQEHFISRSILDIIGPFSIKGFPWLSQGEIGKASAGSLTASVLCERHNSLLSDYDSEAANLLIYLKLLDGKVTPQQFQNTPVVLSIDGVKLEKWLLKTLCGIMASGNFLIEGKGFGKIPPSNYLVSLLFSNKPWNTGIGLYTDYTERERVNAHHGIGYDPVTVKLGTHAQIVGIDVHFWGFPLRGMFATYEDGQPLENYRPTSMRFVNETVSREIRFSWTAGSATSAGPIFTRDGTKR